MANRINSTSDFWSVSEADILGNGNDGTTQSKATKNIIFNPEGGNIQTQLSVDGDLRQIDGTNSLTTSPTANTTGTATDKRSQPFLLRWIVKLLQPIANGVQAINARFDNPIAVSGNLTATVNTSTLATEVTQSAINTKLAGALTVNTGLTGLATQTTLTSVDSRLAGTLTVLTPGGVLSQGSVNIPTAGTPVQMPSKILLDSVLLQWHPNNVGKIYYGSSSVGNNNSSAFLSSSFAAVSLNIRQLSTLYINSDNPNDKILWVAL